MREPWRAAGGSCELEVDQGMVCLDSAGAVTDGYGVSLCLCNVSNWIKVLLFRNRSIKDMVIFY
jgi:hypothetical protein